MIKASLPTLDISDYLANPDSEQARSFVNKLRETSHGIGFFYLVGHGVAVESDRNVMAMANRFFELPLAEREAIAIARSPHFRGYTLLKSEMTAGKQDWRDQIDIGPESPVRATDPGDPPWLKLIGPNQWPQSLPEMPGVISAWMKQMQSVGVSLMQAMAEGLEKPRDYFDDRMSPDPYTRVKVIRYPPQENQNVEEGDEEQGLGLHHDSGILTLILQDAVPGLQVMSKGRLIDVEPMPGAYVINLGEMLQSATSGYLKATKHQVVRPTDGRHRISIAFFLNPRLDARFEPFDLPEALASEATGGQNSDGEMDPDDPVFATFGANTLKIRMRAHPDVSAAHYAGIDLTDL